MIGVDIEAAVIMIAAADTALNSLIGDRLHYGQLPAEGFILPAAVFQLISSTRDHKIDARSARFQFTAWAANPPAAGAVEAAIEDTFIRYKGRMAADLVIIQGIVLVPGYDMPSETDIHGTRFGRACDIVLYYRTDI